SYDSTKTYVLDTTKTSSSFVWTTDGQVFDVYYAVDMVGTPGTPTGPDGIPDMYQFPVNFKVVNGIWSDTSSADKVVYLTKLLNGVWNVNGTATLTSGQIPTGMTPNTGYILPGSWDTTPNTTTPLSQAATYTFTFTVDTRVFNITYTLNSVTNPPYTPALSTLNETGVLHGTNKNVKGNLTTTSVTNGIVIGTWTFSGWTPTTPSNITVANGAFTMPTNDVEFTGSWSFTKAGEFTVVYSDGSGNTYAGGTYDTGIPYTVLGNGTTNFTKDGHFFAGWSNNAGKTNAVGATDTSSSSTTITYTAVWRADDFGYTVNYYKDSVSSDNLLGSESGTGTFGANIPYTDGNYLPAGYVIPGTLGGQTTITSTAANNVLNVVYAKNSAVGYTVRYYTRPSTNGPWTEIGSITSTGTFGAAIPYNLYLYFPSSGYDSNVYFSGALTISADASANIVNIVYTKLPDPIDPTNPTNPTNPTSPTSPTNPTINDDEVDIEDNETPLAGLLGLLNTEDHFNYVIGYEDGTVHPNGNLTRAEATTIFFRLLTEEARAIYLTEENEFSDVNEGQWFNAAISTLASIGIVTGYEDGTFRPNAMITRAELAAIIARFAELEGSAQFVFTDINGHWAEASILLAASNGWITGYENGTFRPNLAITRAETVTMINRVLDRLPKNKEALLEEMLTFSDNLDTEEWYYIPIQEATNYHKYAKNEAGETWTELIENIDWTIYEQ
ncbi:MAG: S-layer homology domain-containing protein, partial [Clostridiaceae bacterium]|nr:S-layer homology domain-containing protein [Clostridiaceae bacterium]